MSDKPSKFFSVMVIGENPQELMAKYSIDRKVEPYIKYRYMDASKYRDRAICHLEGLLSQKDGIELPSYLTSLMKSRLSAIKKQSPFEYYQMITNGLYYNEDGDALSTTNPLGFWKTAHIARNFANPLILKDGSQAYMSYAKDIDFQKMDNLKRDIYERTWDLIMGGAIPESESDKQIVEAMQDKTNYLSSFGTKDNYVRYSTKYWNHAVVNEADGWRDADILYMGDINEWIENFHSLIIDKLLPDEKVTIYECTICD